MRRIFVIAALALLSVVCSGGRLHAQTPPAAEALHISTTERQYFALGDMMARGAFAYAELSKQATLISKVSNKSKQVQMLGDLAPVAQRNRLAAHDQLVQAQTLMQTLHIPALIQVPLVQMIAHLEKPIAFTGDAKLIAAFNKEAGVTLAALKEFDQLSSLPENAKLQHWLAPSSQAWYAEGVIEALAEIASAQQMPDLLPPLGELATDLRGMRDWLATRIPEQATPEQTALKTAIDSFLQQTAGQHKSHQAVTLVQLTQLSDISQQLKAQILLTPTNEKKIDEKKTPALP